jgi:valine--pyruvate aminotransferase
MSDKRAAAAPGAGPGAQSATRLINPRVRTHMETLSLQRFYGGYQIVEIGEQVFNLGIGEVGNVPLPEGLDAVYKRFIQDEALVPLALRYSGTMGERRTNRLVAAALNAWLGEERFTENLVVSLDGGQNAVEVAVRAFTSPLGTSAGGRPYVLMAAPSYPYLSAIVAANAGVQSFLAYDAESLTRGVETYANPAVGLILINVPHNPMSYALNAAQVARINRVAGAYDCAILVDGVYANYPDDPSVGRALAGFDPERTVYADSFSKKYGLPGLRLGFALSAAAELTYAMRFIKMSESLTPSNVKLAFAGHLLERYADVPLRIGTEVRQRRRRFLERFAARRLEGVRPFGEGSNPFYLALDIGGLSARTGLTDLEVAKYCLDNHQVRVFPGAFVYPNPALRPAFFGQAGRHNPHDGKPYLPPNFPEGAPIVFAPDGVSGRIPLLRLSFGTETRVEAAAEALGGALSALWAGG